GVGVVGVCGPGLGPLGEGEHEHPAEAAGQPPEHPGPQGAAPGVALVLTEQPAPVLLVTALGLGEREEDLTFLPLAAAGEVAVHRGLGALVGQVATPAPDL